MGKFVSKELRKVLDNPATRHRIVDAWLVRKDQEIVRARLAFLEAAKGAVGAVKALPAPVSCPS